MEWNIGKVRGDNTLVMKCFIGKTFRKFYFVFVKFSNESRKIPLLPANFFNFYVREFFNFCGKFIKYE